MKPYYESKLGKLYHGSCLDIMPELEPNIDMVCSDPPYGTTACAWDSIIPLEPMWEQLKRLIKDNGAIVMTASQPFTTTLISSNINMFKYCWYWRKTKAIGFQHAKNKPMKIIEECCVFSKASMGHKSILKEKRMVYNPQNISPLKEKIVSGIWHGNMMGARPNQVGKKYMAYTGFPNDLFLDFKQPIGNKTIHPTQKPVALMEYLIKTYTNEGETVLDFACGSGTTGIACERLKGINMKESLPLHLKYRPKTFSEIIGNESLKISLESVLQRSDNQVRSFLFIGPSGSGKTTLARIIKNELKCSDVDFKELNAANVRGIDTIREIASNASLAPMSGSVKIYLIDECHQLTGAAANALLKLLEDTPKHVRLILCTTEPEKLLTTIKNRCTTYQVSTLRKIEIIKLLKNVLEKEGVEGFPEEAIKEICKAAEGCPRQALVILDQIIDIEDDDKLIDAINNFSFQKEAVIELLRALLGGESWLRVSEILKGIEEEPEQIRYAALGYFSKVLISNNGNLDRTSGLIELFSENFLYTKRAGLIQSCFLATKLRFLKINQKNLKK